MKNHVYLLSLTLILFSCGNTSEEVIIDDKYLLDNIDLESNTEKLSQLKKDLLDLETINHSKSNKSNKTIFTEVETLKEIGKIFNSETCPCSLPNKVKRSLRGVNWVPKEVHNLITDHNVFPVNAYKVDNESANSLIHRVTVVTSNKRYNIAVAGAPTYTNMNVTKFMLTGAKSNFMYSLDCSGYLNAAISASGGFIAGNIKSETEAALTNQKSLFLASGTVISPIAAAYYGGALGINLDTIERIKILESLLELPNITENDTIIIHNSYQLMWTSMSGDSGFNGKTDFSADAGGGAGGTKLSFMGSAGGNITRKSSYSMYNTYFTDARYFPDAKPFTIREVKAKIQSLKL